MQPFYSDAWFLRIGEIFNSVARECQFPITAFSLVEIMSDGPVDATGLLPGIRFELRDGAVTLTRGVDAALTADVEILSRWADAAVSARQPKGPERQRFQAHRIAMGHLVVKGDLSPVSELFDKAHDLIVEVTGTPREAPTTS